MRRSFALFCGLLVLSAGLPARAQDPNHVLSHGDATINQTGSADAPINYDNTSADSMAGWSWGCCILDPSSADISAVNDGATTATVNGGVPPAFNAPSIIPGQGWTIGVVINFFGDNPLPPGTGYELNIATYVGLAFPTSTDVCFCDTLGMPPVVTTLVAASGASISPTTICGTITVQEGDPPFKYIAPFVQVTYNPDQTDTASGSATVAIEERPENPGFPNDTAGFSMGLPHDPAIVTVDAIDPTPLETALGGPPSFFGPALLGNGWTVGVVYDFFGNLVLAFPNATGVITADYTVTGLMGDLVGFSTPLAWTDTLGMPAVSNTVVVGADANGVEFVDGALELIPSIDEAFRRGDCNDDGLVDIGDGIHILDRLFQGVPALGDCEEACDANKDASFDSSDAIYILNYRFLQGPPPPSPFPTCDPEPGADCEEHESCP